MLDMKGLLAGFAWIFLSFLAYPANAQVAPVLADVILGKADAPVTIIEYASFTCPHCAAFHTGTMPQLKSNYIETGKVKFIFRDFPLDEPALRASQLARCAGSDRYYSFVDVLFQQQQSWSRSTDPIAALQQLARLGGIGEADFKACLANKQVEEAALGTRLQGEKDQVNSTPSFLVNGKLISGALPFEEFEKHLIPLLKGADAGGTSPAAQTNTSEQPKKTKKKKNHTWRWIIGGVVVVVVIGGAAFYWTRRKKA